MIATYGKIALLSFLLAATPASRLAGVPQKPPAPPAPPAAPAPPAPPASPEAPEAPEAPGDIIVELPDLGLLEDLDGHDLVVDEERVITLGDEDSPMVLRKSHRGGGGFIGVRPIEMTEELRQHFGAPKDAGIMVGSVEANGPAAKAGLQVGDIITSADGEKVDSTRDLLSAVRNKKSGETIKLEVSRNRAMKTLTLTVAQRPEKELRVSEFPRKRVYKFHSDEPGAFEWDGPAYFKKWSDPKFEERLDQLEERLKELEGRLSK